MLISPYSNLKLKPDHMSTKLYHSLTIQARTRFFLILHFIPMLILDSFTNQKFCEQFRNLAHLGLAIGFIYQDYVQDSVFSNLPMPDHSCDQDPSQD